MLDKFIHFFVDHIVAIIEIVFVVVIPMTILIVYRSFKQERDQLDMSVDQMKSLEEILKKHLSKLPTPTGVVSSVGVPAEGSAEMQTLIKEKESMIHSLNDKISQLEKATQTNPGVDPKEWEKKIADLKDRLAEYEIIEDDIANLTFYKSENVRLKEELAKLAGNVGSPPPVATTVAAAPAASQSTAAGTIEDLMASAANVQATAAAGSEPATVITFPVSTPSPAPVNVMSEFEAAVKQKNALEQATSKIKPAKSSRLAVDEDDENHAKKPEFPIAMPKEGDIISEFSAAVGKVEPDNPGFQATNVDSEKLLAEIGDMATKPVPEAKEAGDGDDSKKLISEFEAFVKGSN